MNARGETHNSQCSTQRANVQETDKNEKGQENEKEIVSDQKEGRKICSRSFELRPIEGCIAGVPKHGRRTQNDTHEPS